jgi:hypothetical protein
VLNHTALECLAAQGVGTNHSWSITIGSQPSPFSHAMTSYAQPDVLLFTREYREEARVENGSFGMSTWGGEIIEITGTHLGPVDSENVAFAEYQTYLADPCPGTTKEACLAGALYTTHNCSVVAVLSTDNDLSLMECMTVPGVGQQLGWWVTVGGQQSSKSSSMTRYQYPQIHSLHLSDNATTLDTLGGSTVLLEGIGFGPAIAANLVATYFQTAEGAGVDGALNDGTLRNMRYKALNCTVTADHVNMSCTTPPGVGAYHIWSAYVGGQELSVQSLLDQVLPQGFSIPIVYSSFDPPAVLDVLIETAALNTTGGQRVVIRGSGFGPSAASLLDAGESAINAVSARYRNFAMDSSLEPRVWITAPDCKVTVSDSEILCTSGEGVGYGHLIRATVGGQESADAPVNSSFAYQPPHLDIVDPFVGPSIGGTVVTLTGSNFGPSDQSSFPVYVDVSGVACTVLEKDHTWVQCRMPATEWGEVGITATTGNQTSDTSMPFYVHKALRLSPDHGPIAGTTSLLLQGHGFVSFSPVSLIQFTPSTEDGDLRQLDLRFINSSTYEVVSPSVPAGTWDVFPKVCASGPISFIVLLRYLHSPIDFVLAQVSFNNRTWTSLPFNYTYYDPPVPLSTTPMLGPMGGNTSIVIQGYDFFDTGVVRAKFGGGNNVSFSGTESSNDAVVDCELITWHPEPGMADLLLDEILCPTPPSNASYNLSRDSFGFSDVELLIDTAASADRRWATGQARFYYHRELFAVREPMPAIIPADSSSVSQALLFAPEVSY